MVKIKLFLKKIYILINIKQWSKCAVYTDQFHKSLNSTHQIVQTSSSCEEEGNSWSLQNANMSLPDLLYRPSKRASAIQQKGRYLEKYFWSKFSLFCCNLWFKHYLFLKMLRFKKFYKFCRFNLNYKTRYCLNERLQKKKWNLIKIFFSKYFPFLVKNV